MNARHLLPIALLACMPLVACSNTSTPSATPAAKSDSSAPAKPTSALGRLVDKEIQEARVKLKNENIGLNGTIRIHSGERGGTSVFTDDGSKDDRPKAEITPAGDLLIDGKAVAINPDQRKLLLAHRDQVIEIAEAGMDIGVQGADLAAKAMGEAFSGIFSGKSEKEIEKSVESEAGGIKQAAAKLCGRLPALMESQQKLAAAVPEFKPYARMTRDDIEDCMKDSEENHTAKTAERAEIREEIRDEIRSAIRDSVRGEAQADAKKASDKDAETAAKR